MEKITKPSDTVLIDPNEPLILPDGTALVGRIEWFLYSLCCLDYQNLPTPMSRIEEFANALITGEIPNIEPQSRAEQFFLAILDGNVSDLPQPQSRSEVLLDKLARGEFDLSDVEPIQSRYELLLAYLIKNGGIGNIDYVLYEFSEAMKTMYNTVEKPFKSLELSGNTKVNVLQESVEDDVIVPYQVDECQGATLTDTKETGSLDNLVINGRTLVNSVLEDTSNSDYVAFDQDYEGQSFTINGTNEGAIGSAILKGQTLVNVITHSKRRTRNVQNLSESNGKITWDTVGTWGKVGFTVQGKPNTSYCIMYSDKHDTVGLYLRFAESVDGPTNSITNLKPNFRQFTTNETGIFTLTLEQAEATTNNWIKNFMILEYQEGMENWDIPYFEGMQSVKMPVLTTIGKNLFDESKKIEGFIDNASIKEELNTSVKNTWTTTWIKAKPNTSYTMQGGNRNRWQIKSRSNVITFVDKKTITTLSDTEYIRCYYCNETYTASNVQLEEAPSSTTYEPYKSNILSCNEDVTLRCINNKKDTLDYNSGIKTEMIGEMVLKGTEDYSQWTVGNQTAEGMIGIYTRKDTIDATENGGAYILCDKLPIAYRANLQNTTENSVIKGNGYIGIVMKANSVDEVKAWLRENPITVQYGLKSAVNKEVQIDIVDQDGTKIDKMHVFNEVTHVNASSDELTPTVNIGKSVSYPTIIKPNTKYTVDLKRNDKPLTVNLGGTEVTFASGETRKTITTPSTLTNDKLSYYGIGQKCSDIMVLEGEVEGNIDYFTGMQSVKSPVVSTVGKNLFNKTKVKYNTGINMNGIEFTNSNANNYVSSDFIEVKENTVYYIQGMSVVMSYDKNKEFLRTIRNLSTNGSFTTPNGCKYIRIRNWELLNTLELQKEIVNITQLEQGSSATSYEPHKSTILSLLEEVKLCSIDNTKDMIDYSTKTLTKNINEVVFDGSDDENWRMYPDSERDNTLLFQTGYDIPFGKNHHCISDKYKHNSSLWNTNFDEEGIMIGGGGSNYKRLDLRIAKNKLSSYNVDGLKSYLQSNPITVQYRLAEPTIEQVDTLIVDHDNISQTKLNTFNDTTHIMTSSDELIPIIKCDGKLEYPVVIKPSTQYTILANTSANAHALNNIAFDLGGAKVTNTFGTRKITITTPSTLANNSLTITGEGAKIGELMVLEGNESDIVPYFEGMSSCKMPILHTVGKNLLYKHNDVGNTYGISQFHDGGFTTGEMGSYGTFGCIRSLNNPTQTQLDKNPTSVQKGKTYTISCEVKKMSGTSAKLNYLRFTGYNNAGDNYSWTNIGWNSAELNYDYNNTVKLSKTIECDCSYKHIVFAGQVSSDSSSAIYKITNIQLEESSSSTTYEDHKTSILSYNDDVTLRGTGDIRDTLDCLTGEIVERVGVGVFDGSEDEGWQLLDSNDNYVTFVTYRPLPNIKDNKNSICDKLPFQGHMTPKDGEYHSVQSFGSYINVLSSKASNVVEFKNWLSQNNLTIYYPLTTESIKTVDLSVVDQDGNTIPKVKSYNGTTHLEVTIPKQSLLPNVSAEVATDNSKDMSSLTIKHQEISETQSAIQDNIQSQSDEIDTALMATTEIFESILE